MLLFSYLTLALSGQAEPYWRQVLSVPQLGGRLTAIAVDPETPRNLWVGTEEATILVSTDGGDTWLERPLSPHEVTRRGAAPLRPQLAGLGDDDENIFEWGVYPPDLGVAASIPLYTVVRPFPTAADFFFFRMRPRLTWSQSERLLDSVTSGRADETTPVVRIVWCPNHPYPLMVATRREVFGGNADATIFVRLYADPLSINGIACSSNQVAVATDSGLYVSTDGATFDPGLLGAFGAVAFIGGKLYASADEELWAGAPGAQLEPIYPTGDPATAPWGAILAISGRGSELWLATESGPRGSLDGGRSWFSSEVGAISDAQLEDIVRGQDHAGRPLTVALTNRQSDSGLLGSALYATDAQSWVLFFSGLTRRSFRQLAAVPRTAQHPAGFWLVTSGEVWTNYGPGASRPDPDAQRWAQKRRARTPPLGDTLERAYARNHLTTNDIEGIATRAEAATWMPYLDAYGHYENRSKVSAAQQSFTAFSGGSGFVQQIDDLRDTPRYGFYVQASWDLTGLNNVAAYASGARRQLQSLREQLGFAVEDAWHERMMLLLRLEEGLSEPVALETTKTRILALEAMLSIWLGDGPFEETP